MIHACVPTAALGCCRGGALKQNLAKKIVSKAKQQQGAALKAPGAVAKRLKGAAAGASAAGKPVAAGKAARPKVRAAATAPAGRIAHVDQSCGAVLELC